MVSRHIRAVAMLVISFAGGQALSQPAASTLPGWVDDQLIIGFVPGTPGLVMAEAHRAAGAAVLRTIPSIGATVVAPSGGRQTAIASYSGNPNVRYVERNALRVLVLPDEGQDPPPPMGLGIDYFAEQYALHNAGQGFYYDAMTGAPGAIVGSADADIDAPEAWDLHTGSPAVTVAVLDSGVECVHPDLAGKCVENINLGPSDTPDDLLGHGTHVAGIIGATGNNGIGVAGVSWATTLASIKVCYEYFDLLYGLVGLCDAAASAAGIVHAADNGYAVINMSYGGPTGSQAEEDAIEYAWTKGTVLVAAAANAYALTPMYPAAFDHVIAVAATDWFDNIAGFSNFGPWVSLAAPGAQIFATLPSAACGLQQGDPEGCYGWLSGTSMASPTVAGAAALVWSYLGASATNTAVRAALETGADATGAMGQNMLAWTQHGRLNLHGALTGAGGGSPPPPPAPGVHIGDLDATAASQGSTWTAFVTIRVHDENELPVDGMWVSGTWSEGDVRDVSCETAAGECTVQSGAVPKRTSAVQFTASGLIGAVYQPGSNHDPDGDSDGRSLTITR